MTNSNWSLPYWTLGQWPLTRHSRCLTAEDELFSCLLPFTLHLRLDIYSLTSFTDKTVRFPEIIHCQGLRRRKLRPRLQPAKDEEEQVAEVEEEEVESPPGIGPRLRTRQRALGARMEADYEARGQRPGRLRPGRRRPTGGRRPGRLRRLRGRRPLPVTLPGVSCQTYICIAYLSGVRV